MNDLSLLRCLADEARLGIVKALADAPRCVTDLVEHTGKERTNVSHHLAELRSCGLVVRERDGRHVNYELAHSSLADLVDRVGELADHVACTQPEACAEQGCCV